MPGRVSTGRVSTNAHLPNFGRVSTLSLLLSRPALRHFSRAPNLGEKMSSPARSSTSQQLPQIVGSGVAGLGDENSSFHFSTDHLISSQDLKEDALLVLKSDVMAALQKEVKSLDEDSWKFAGPRSQIHLISRPCGHPFKRIETAKK